MRVYICVSVCAVGDGRRATVHSDWDLCSRDLDCKGFWELSLRARSRAVWEVVGTGEDRLEGSGSCWNVQAGRTPPSFSQGWALLVKPALSPFSKLS